SRRRKNISTPNPSCGTRRTRRAFWRSSCRDLLSRALRDSIRGEAGLRFVLRKGSALPTHAALPAVRRARQHSDSRSQDRKRDSLVARAGRILRAIRKSRRENPRPCGCAAGAFAARIPLSIRAEISKALGAFGCAQRVPGFLCLEGYSGDSRDCGCRSRKLVVKEQAPGDSGSTAA